MSEAGGFADSLRQQARWIRESLEPTTRGGQDMTLADVDTDELDDAAEEIDKLQRELTASLVREGEMIERCAKIADSFAKRRMEPKAKPTIEELERLLQQESSGPININPDGSIGVGPSEPEQIAERIRALASPAPSSGEKDART